VSRYDYPIAAAAPGTPVATALRKTKTAPPKIKKGWNGQRMAVSPFDGVNRIRFKGSPGFLIADLRLAYSDDMEAAQSKTANLKFPRLSAANAAPPKRYLIFNLSKGF
jgi:hypothetical protein